MEPTTVERVRGVVAAYLDLPLERVDAASRLDELGVDSLDAIELVFKIEEEFKVLVPNDRLPSFTTIQAIGDGVDALRAASAATAP